MKYFTLLIFFLLASCLKDDVGPEAALKEFVDSRAGQVIDREFVLERSTGKMYQSFENMSEEDFLKFADMRNIKVDKFKVHSRSCQEKKCYITYSIGYTTKKDDKVVYSSEVKKIAEMIEVEKKWLISDISNIKTYHESNESINPLE